MIRTNAPARVVDFYAANPGASIDAVAAAVFPDLHPDSRASKVVSCAARLCKLGRLKRLERGRYMVAPEKKGRVLGSLKLKARVRTIEPATLKLPTCVVFETAGFGVVSVYWPPGSALPELGARWTFEGKAS
jgi:hypothetical protein